MNTNNHSAAKIYLIEDRMSLSRCYTEFLSHEGPEIVTLSTGKQALDLLNNLNSPNLFLLDLQLKDEDGFYILDKIREKSPQSAVVVITSNGSYEISRRVMEAGAVDYLEKPFTRDRLCVTMRNALKQLKLQKVVNPYGEGFGGFIGSSLAMQTVYRMIEAAAASNKASVFVTGESGTGKEVCSQAIHQLSDRRNHECVVLNCAAIPKDLMESEIFGHVKGAFTGAVNHRDGAARRAHLGTLFLDEIGEMDMDLQSKLLRFIQTGQFQKVGSNEMETVDVRFVCATNRDPLREVAEGRFREDLYYRLNVVPIELPPLRERDEDIVIIAEHYLSQFAREEGKSFERLSDETRKIFLKYHWPGNVRQLLNVVRNIVVMNKGIIVEPDMLPAVLKSPAPQYDAPYHPSFNPASNQHPVYQPSNAFQTGQHAHTLNNHRSPNASSHSTTNAYGQNSNGSINGASHLASQGRQVAATIESIKPLWLVEMETIDQAVNLCEGNVSLAAKLLEISPSTIYRKKPVWKKNLDAHGIEYRGSNYL